MDPFEVRMQFLSHLRKLNAYVVQCSAVVLSWPFDFGRSTQQSIQKVVGYALKWYPKCGEDLWSCITDECRDVCPFHASNV